MGRKKRKTDMWYNTIRKINGEKRKVRVRRMSNGKEQIQILHPKRKSLARINLSAIQEDIGIEIADTPKDKTDYFNIRREFGWNAEEKRRLSNDLKKLQEKGLIKKQIKKSDYEASLELTPVGKKYFK